ncbi:MAG: hypothetical protein AMJ54_11190 [Deltaproteobacteria bacterium SG8_13]|nr:MAG: hypothetical protein AMJ54_11190 [Deltaproteobacteria bacterium SG8_13]
MKDPNMSLDADAAELYRQLDGIDLRQLEKVSGDGFSQGLTEVETRNDAARMLLADLICQVSSCLLQSSGGTNRNPRSGMFDKLKDTIEKLIRNYDPTRTILIRYKGNYEETGNREHIDYEIVFGKFYLDLAEMAALARRRGMRENSRQNRLADAFETFWNCSVYNLLLRLPREEKEYKRLWIGLQILYRYLRALEKGSPVEFKMSGRQLSYPVVKNESGKPDPNLTLLAIFNQLPSDKIQTLVQKVLLLSKKSESGRTRFAFTTTYDAILGLKNLRGKWNVPPLELNNVKWLIVEDEQHEVSQQMARVARYVTESYGESVPEASRVLKSVYGNDYEKIDSNQVAQRLTLTSDLLTRMDQKDANQDVKTEVLENVWTRLGLVNDGIYDNLIVGEDRIEAQAPGKKTFIAKLHDKLIGLVGFHKNRTITKKKMTDMVHQVIDFDQQDYDTIAQDFEIGPDDARNLIRTLKGCFDDDGHFRKSSFINAIGELERYESKIFDFLWHNLKETLHQSDRPAFLDALQMLVDRISQRKNSISVLLQDLVTNPAVVRFADQKAFMLGNRLVRKNTGTILSYQITPEDVLRDLSGLDQPVANYAAWKIDREQESFFEKMRTIHLRLIDLLEYEGQDTPKMTAKDLFALEREAYLFFSQCGGSTGWSVLMSALKEYGHPESDVYNRKASKQHLADLLQLLKIVVRGIGAVGGEDERVLIESVINRLPAFSTLTSSMHQEDLIIQIREIADEAIHRMSARGE